MALGSTNVTITLVKNALGESSNALSTLCKSNKIKKWSAWKPISCTDATLTLAIVQNNRYGLSVIKATGITNFINAVDAAVGSGTFGAEFSAISYVKPTSNFRLGDFRNYNHAALEPLSTTWDGLTIDGRTFYNMGINGIPIDLDNTLQTLINSDEPDSVINSFKSAYEYNLSFTFTDTEIKKLYLYPSYLNKVGIFIRCMNASASSNIYNTWYTDKIYAWDPIFRDMWNYAPEYEGHRKAIQIYMFLTNASKDPNTTSAYGKEFWSFPRPIEITSLTDNPLWP